MMAGVNEGNTRLIFCAEWGRNREQSWSGTYYGLRTGLSRIFEVNDVDLEPVIGFRDKVRSVRRHIGTWDLDLAHMRRQQRAVDAMALPAGVPYLQFGEVPAVRAGERHYIYQDLAVEWLWRCRRRDPETFARTGFSGASEAAFRRRVASQRAFYCDCAGILTMGRWMADFLVGECGLPASKVHPVLMCNKSCAEMARRNERRGHRELSRLCRKDRVPRARGTAPVTYLAGGSALASPAREEEREDDHAP